MRTSHSHEGAVSFTKQKCLPLPRLVSFLTFSCISSFTFPSLPTASLHCDGQRFIRGSFSPKCLYNETSGVKNLFVSMLMRLSQSIPPVEPASTHSCTHTHAHTSALHAVRVYRPRDYNILFFLHIRPDGGSPHCYLL